MAKIEAWLRCDLKKPVQVQGLSGNVFSMDNNGSRINVRIYDNGEKTTVSGSVTANCILADGSTINVNGSLTTDNGQSVAYVDIPQSCLLVPGPIRIAIKLTASGVITTLAAVVTTVYRTQTDIVITPSAQIITDWNAEISAAIATQNAAIANQDTKINDLKSALKANRIDYEDALPPATKNLFNPLTITEGYFVNDSTGAITANASYALSDYIRVSPGHQYKTPHRFGFAGYDEDYNFIACSISSGVITTASDVVWLRVSFQLSQLSTMYVADGNVTVSTDYLRTVKETPKGTEQKIKHIQDCFDRSTNLFDISAITEGYFINDATGAVTASANYCYSDYIEVKPSTIYTVKNGLFGGGCYDNNMNFVPWTLASKTITTPANAKFMRLSMAKANATTQWCIEGTGTSADDFKETIKLKNLPKIPQDKIGSTTFQILLPDTIYLMKDSDFSIYYDAIVYPLELFDKTRFVITQKTSANAVKGETYDYKWHYTPSTAGETFTMVFAIRDLHTNEIVVSKNVDFVVSSAKSSQSKNVIFMGDSFMDGYGISGYTYGNIVNSGNSLTVLGVNSANSSQYPNLKDNAWAGQGYRWVSGGYSWSKQGGLRNDRPLDDAYWDDGWGKDEPNGWTEGQTYWDLTSTQRSHGHTKNEFFNPSTELFDFQYYLTTYQSGATCDILISEYGLNDVGWMMDANETPTWTIDNFVMPAIKKVVDSAKASNASIKIALCLIPPNNNDNNSIGRYYANGNNKITNRNIQYFNMKLLETYSDNANVILIPSHCNFDDRYGYLTTEYEPIKFDTTIKETLSSDIHPSEIGAKFYADSMTNVLYYLL